MIRSLLSSLAVLAAVCSCVLLLCPEDSLKRYVRFSCTLCALCVIVSAVPRSGASSALPEYELPRISDTSYRVAEMTAEETVKRLERAAESFVSEKYGVPTDEVHARITYGRTENGEIRLTSAAVTLDGLAHSFLTVDIKRGVSELLGVPCEVIVNE